MSNGSSLRAIGEFGLIKRIACHVPAAASVAVGIGDDAAALLPTPGQASLITTDMLVEGIHFDCTYSDPFSLGRKSLAVNLSDIAAMGGTPRYFLLSLAIPPAVSLDFIDAFTQGMFQQAEEYGVVLIGGDTCSSLNNLVISVTVLGEQTPDKIVRRAGAREGDFIFITGTVGDSALGLRQLKQGHQDGPAVHRHLNPVPRVREGFLLAEHRIPSAMIDLSDGLLADLEHILESSSVGAQVTIDSLPLSESFLKQMTDDVNEYLTLALSGGEDYELLFTVPPENVPKLSAIMERQGTPITKIGTITKGPGLTVINAAGNDISITSKGYNHFPEQ